MVFWSEPSLIELLWKRMCKLMTTKMRCNSSWIAELSTLWYAVFNHFFFLNYYSYEFANFFSSIHIYNIGLKEKYGDDSSTHPNLDPNLWLEIESFGGPDWNRVYDLFDTTSAFLQTAHNVWTVWCSQLILSTQTPGWRQF